LCSLDLICDSSKAYEKWSSAVSGSCCHADSVRGSDLIKADCCRLDRKGERVNKTL